MSPACELRVLNTPEELFHAAAKDFVERAVAAVAARGRFSVALSGGNTPRTLYRLLATAEYSSLPWNKICFFWGDERNVPPDHPNSNFRMADETLLSKVPVRAENIFRFKTEAGDPATVAFDYEKTVADFFAPPEGEFPRFDLILLGMGPDGHTASLFPGTAALQENTRLVVANWVEKLNAYRFTLTFPVINHAACVSFLAMGQDKAALLADVLEGPSGVFPAQNVQPAEGKLLWFLDRSAASALKGAV